MGITLIVIAVSFALGIAAGWATGLVPDAYRAATSVSPSPSPTPSPTPTIDVSLPPLDPIVRDLTDDDAAAGVTTTTYNYRGDGTFSVVPGEDDIPSGDVPTRLVRIDVEDGIDVDPEAFGAYVMSVLNDPRGWGSEGRINFIQTQGVPDLRIAIASPYTATALCPNPHSEGESGDAVVEPTEEASDPDATASPTAAADTCADRGTASISQYDWIAGLAGYGDDVDSARKYLITHATGHVLGEAETSCESGEALVMADQREPMDDCTVNPWAFPDAPMPAATSSPEPSASS
jgi:hypothetical protein